MLPDNPHPQTIYNFIDAYWKKCGYAPSPKEIAKHVTLSYTATYGYLVELRARGVIDWKPHTIRTIRITGEYRRG